ncbi:MAG: hypothetical protein J2P21_11860 [Chloracidobacterium sp.]|nr:hypothetical protein [Chloracidobacterium sp.]
MLFLNLKMIEVERAAANKHRAATRVAIIVQAIETGNPRSSLTLVARLSGRCSTIL